MNVEIFNSPLALIIHGFSGIAINNDYADTAFKLMDRMWKIVKSDKLENKGLNIWVYESGHRVFAGVELTGIPDQSIELEKKEITLSKYAYYKHIGPYNLIKKIGENMQAEIRSKGFETTLPYIEIYGHWTPDETKLETELLMTLK